MNGRPFRIAAAGLCAALMASIVAGVSHFRTESRLIAGAETLPIYSATIALMPEAERPVQPEAALPVLPEPPSELIASTTPASAPEAVAVDVPAATPVLPPLPVSGAPVVDHSSRLAASVASAIRRKKKEFVELPPPPEFLDEPEPVSELVVAPLPVRQLEEPDNDRLLQEIATLRREMERLAQTHERDREAQRLRDEQRLAHQGTEERLRQLQSTIDDLTRRQFDQRIAMLDGGPAAGVLDRPVPPPEHTTAVETPSASAIDVTAGDAPDRFHFQIRTASLADVLTEIGQRGAMNLVVAPNVQGTMTATWKNLTARDALDAVTAAYNLKTETRGDCLVVSVAPESRSAVPATRDTIVQMFRPLYIAGRDLRPLIEPLLTPGIGRVAVTLPKSAEEAGRETGGGDSLAQPDAVVVVDYPEIIEIVTRTIAEIDVPAPHVELEATILDVQLSGRVRNGVGALVASGEFSNRPGFVRLDDPEPLPCDSCCQTCDLSCGEVIDRLKLWTDVKLVSNARLLVLNKQPAELCVGTESLTLLHDRMTQPVATVDSATRLFVRPFVAADHLVRLEVSPEATTARLQPMNIRRESFASVGTNVTVPNGGTLVIAGLSVDESVAPSALFKAFGRLKHRHRDQADRATRRELVIMITPRILPECPPLQ